MADLRLASNDGLVVLSLLYEGEPPHGDTYHTAKLGESRLPGLFWGCNFALSRDSRYLVASWMAEKFERKTIVADCQAEVYFVLPCYMYDFQVLWPKVARVGTGASAYSYEFTGNEQWEPWAR